jgi:hypothetical protein
MNERLEVGASCNRLVALPRVCIPSSKVGGCRIEDLADCFSVAHSRFICPGTARPTIAKGGAGCALRDLRQFVILIKELGKRHRGDQVPILRESRLRT